MKTSAKKLAELKEAKEAAIKEYNAYLKLYNEQHGLKGGTIIKEIIALAKKGKTNREIIDLGYNKSTVNQQVGLFRKGKRVAKTVVAKYLPPKEKK